MSNQDISKESQIHCVKYQKEKVITLRNHQKFILLLYCCKLTTVTCMPVFIFNILTLRVKKVWNLNCHSLNKIKSFLPSISRGGMVVMINFGWERNL